jgi:high-affinity K+ transport system ATPase subunit B
VYPPLPEMQLLLLHEAKKAIASAVIKNDLNVFMMCDLSRYCVRFYVLEFDFIACNRN